MNTEKKKLRKQSYYMIYKKVCMTYVYIERLQKKKVEWVTKKYFVSIYLF